MAKKTKRKSPGRPPKPANEKLVRFDLWMKPDQKLLIEQLAEHYPREYGLNYSATLRYIIDLGIRVLKEEGIVDEENFIQEDGPRLPR